MRYLIYFLLMALCSSVYAAKIYKWTDEHGKTHYGDRPAGSTAKTKTILKTNKAPTVRALPSSNELSDETKTNSGAGENAAVPVNQSNESKCLAMAREAADLPLRKVGSKPSAKRKSLFKKMSSLCPNKVFKCSTYTKTPEHNVCTASIKKPGDSFFTTTETAKKK